MNSIIDHFNNYLPRTRKLLILIFFISLILRIGFGIYTYQTKGTSEFVDDWDYISYANNIIEQGIFVPDLSTFYTNSHLLGPGFPLIVALLFKIFGESYLSIIILNAIISSLIPILIFYLGKEIFNKQIGIISSLWSIVYVLHIRYIPFALKEVWLAFLFPLTIYLFIIAIKKDRHFLLFIFSMVFAFLIHVDERFITYFPIFIVAFLALDVKTWKSGFKKSVLFAVFVLFLMLPWLVRNYYVYNRPVILTERTALITDRIFGYTNQASNDKKAWELLYYQFEWDDSMIDPILAGEEVPNLKGKRYYSLQEGLQHGFIPHNYSKYEVWWVEFKEFLRPLRLYSEYVGSGFKFHKPWSLKHNLSVGLTYGLLLPCFLIGVYFIIRIRNKYGLFLMVIIQSHIIIHIFLTTAPYFVRNRYRIPIDSFIIIIAFYGIYQIYLQLKSKSLIKRSKISEISNSTSKE